MPSAMHFTERRPFQLVLLTGLVAVVISPALSRAPTDGFPLSTYPMFASNKDVRTTVQQAVGIDQSGAASPIPPRYLGTDEVLQARATLSRAVRKGKASSTKLCAEVAASVAADERMAHIERIELRTVTHDAIVYFTTGATEPLSQKVHARCAVGAR